MNKNIKNDIVEFRQQYIESILSDLDIPSDIIDNYKILMQISESKRSKVFLISHKKTDIKYILKIFDENIKKNKCNILSQLDHPCIPKFIDIKNQNGKIYFIREYFPGETLAVKMEELGGFTENEAVRISSQLCDILSYLHTRKKPIVYRDIKAENVILTKQGKVKLIDFDISREYDNGADYDTVYYGTKEYSPPEQFGFSQTDARTDIYSLGILLLYMLTGSKDKKNITKIKNVQLQKIIRKCTAFSPSERYKNAALLKKELKKTTKQHHKTINIKWALLFCTLALILGFILGFTLKIDDSTPPIFANEYSEKILFECDLIEQAVRLQLDKDEGEEIYMYEIKQIESLHICGNQVFDGCQELLLDYAENSDNQKLYFDSYQGDFITIERGSINSLEDISMMSNLKQLDLVYQNITDITPLQNLPIEWLQIPGNYVSDLSSLENLPLITHLNIDGNPVIDISSLSNLERLSVLDASETYIHDLTPIAENYNLEYLYLNNAKITDVSPLTNLNLINCFLQGNNITDFTGLEHIENLNIDDNP